MNSKHLLDQLQGPPRKKMRKGTKSCTECRRRKIRCTFDPDLPGTCNECRLRGSTCIDQECGVLDTAGTASHHGEQTYSLRERVTQLENVVKGILKRLDENGARGSEGSPSLGTPVEESEQVANTLKGLRANARPTPAPTESEIASADEQIGNAPILQLFDNYVVSHRVDPQSNNDKLSGSKDMSPKAAAVRASLMALLPPYDDISKIVSASTAWWSAWQTNFPEICDKCRYNLTTGSQCEPPMAPAEVAKVLICLSISIEQLPSDFDYNVLRFPFNAREFTERCVAEIDRLVIYDDDFAATLPGIECQMLLAKHHLNQGRPRKAWLICRRAIQFAQLAGVHLSTAKPPRPGDTLFDRRLKIWCSLVTSDRFLSFILGLPYAVSDAAFLPQIGMHLSGDKSLTDSYGTRLAVVLGKLIDRNQDPTKLSLSSTLHLDQDLEKMEKDMTSNSWDSSPCGTSGEHYERIMLRFSHHMIRAMLHMPFMLKSATDRRFQYCHLAALESARKSLVLFKALRADVKPYLCKLSDFLAFMMAMLVVIHLHGYSDMSPTHSKEQDKRDWDLVKEITEILRQAGTQSGGSVAAESAKILSEINSCSPEEICMDSSWDKSCKITVPYFGTITVVPGKKFAGMMNNHRAPHGTANTSAVKGTPDQLYTPPLSNPADSSSGMNGSMDNAHGAPVSQAGYPDESWIQLENVPILPNVDVEFNGFQGFFDDIGQEMWPSLDMDLGLDQGWNLNWVEDTT